jgi:hypothetical protein
MVYPFLWLLSALSDVTVQEPHEVFSQPLYKFSISLGEEGLSSVMDPVRWSMPVKRFRDARHSGLNRTSCATVLVARASIFAYREPGKF